MRLIRCHIDGFGCLQNFDFDFTGNLVSNVWKNGHGKSTLCAFIKAMFFGMKTSRTTDKKDSERKHYQTSPYGGALEFEKDGKTYRIERTFHASSEAGDSANLYINGVEHNDELKDFGGSLFGIDEDSFFSTLLISSSSLKVESTSSMASKLNAAASGIVEPAIFDDAIGYIDEKRKACGSRSLQHRDLKAQLEAADKAIETSQAVVDGAASLFEEQKQLQQLKQQKDEQFKNANVVNALLAKWENLDRLENIAKQEKEKLDAFKPSIGSKTINRDSLEKLQRASSSLASVLGKIKYAEFPQNKAKELQNIKDKYENLQDKLSSISQQKQKCREMENLQVQLSSYEESGHLSDETQRELPVKSYEDAKKAKQEIDSLMESLNSHPVHIIDRPWFLTVLILVVLALAIVGVSLMFATQMLVTPLVCYFLAFVGFAVDACLFLLRRSKRSSASKRKAIKNKIIDKIDERIEIQNKIISKYETLIKGLCDMIFRHDKSASLSDLVKCKTSALQENMVSTCPRGEYKVLGASGAIAVIDTYQFDESGILVLKDGSKAGKIQLAQGKYSVIGTSVVLIPNEACDARYLYFAMSSIDFEKYKVGSGIPHIYFKDYSNERIYYPDKALRKKITKTLDFYETMVEIERKMLSAMQKQKAFLLQSMFI